MSLTAINLDEKLEHPNAIERHVIHLHEDFLAPRICHFERGNAMVLGTPIVEQSPYLWFSGVEQEMFTSLTVDFSFDFAGNVEGAVHMVTYRDLIKDTASEFQGFLITTCVGAFISMVSLVAFLCLHPEKYNLGLMLYEIISRIVF